MSIIKTIYGDILDYPIIAHCISVDAAMDAGLALQVARKYPFLSNQIRSKKLSPGDVFIYEGENQTIFNICPKNFYWQHVGNGISNEEYIANLKKGLDFTFVYLIEKKKPTLWVPRLGCGLDRCYWPDVVKLFANTEINIIVVEREDGK